MQMPDQNVGLRSERVCTRLRTDRRVPHPFTGRRGDS
jgi:hypothetical protein